MALLDLIRNYIPDFTSPLSLKNLNDNFSSIWNKLDGNVKGENISVQTITSTHLQDACIDRAKIAYLAVGTAQIDLLAVTSANMANLSVTTAKIADLAVDNSKIANLSVDSAKIADLSVTNGKIANLAVDTGKIVDLSVTTGKIADLSVTNGKIANLSVDTAKIVDLSVSTAKIANGAIDNAKIGNLAVGTAQIQLGAITNALIGSEAVQTAQIKDGSITDAKIVGLTANKITAGTIDAANITVVNLNAANLTVGKINGSQIDNSTITSANLATSINNSITMAQTTADGKNTVYYATTAPSGSTYKVNDIWFNTADGNKISYWNGTAWTLTQLGNNAIANLDAGKISTGTLNANRIGANTITTAKIQIGINANLVANGMDTMEQYTSVPYYSKSATATVSFDTDNKYYGTKSIKLVGTGSDNYVYLGTSTKNYGCIPVTTGKIYKVSCYAYNPSATPLTAYLGVCGHTAIDGTSAPSAGYTNTSIVNTNGWKRIEFAFTATSQYPYISMMIDTLTANCTCYFDAFQIEEVTSVSQLAGAFKPYGVTFIDGSNITANSITATQINANTITGNKLVVDAITAREIAASTITANEIAGNTITANKMNVTDLSSITANIGTITAGIIQSSNYVANQSGLKLNISSATWDSKNFKILSDGSVQLTDATINGGNITVNSANRTSSVITINNGTVTSTMTPESFEIRDFHYLDSTWETDYEEYVNKLDFNGHHISYAKDITHQTPNAHRSVYYDLTINDTTARLQFVNQLKETGNGQGIILDADTGNIYNDAYMIEGNGYCKLTNGMIMQWGNRVCDGSTNGTTNNIIFPLAFPHACFNVYAVGLTSPYNYQAYVTVNAYSTQSVIVSCFFGNSGVAPSTAQAGWVIVNWFAIGW